MLQARSTVCHTERFKGLAPGPSLLLQEAQHILSIRQHFRRPEAILYSNNCPSQIQLVGFMNCSAPKHRYGKRRRRTHNENDKQPNTPQKPKHETRDQFPKEKFNSMS
ncbi:unnamed protein product [Cercospora beticola]|nr:unnamed protein product [Cercospora beticola]